MPARSASDHIDQSITPEEDIALEAAAATDCSNEELPTFWLDMCSYVPTNVSDFVNLQLNQESYTGYDGKHVSTDAHAYHAGGSPRPPGCALHFRPRASPFL